MARRVLIVDDDSDFRATARGLLAGLGYEVVGQVGTAADARRAVQRLRPDAVLLDVHLPDGDGLSLAGELRDGAAAPRILLTSSDSTAAPQDAVAESGATGFVAKTDLVITDLVQYLA